MVIEYPLSESTMRGDLRRFNLCLVIIPLPHHHHPVLATAQFMLNAINIGIQAQGRARFHSFGNCNSLPRLSERDCWLMGGLHSDFTHTTV